MSKVLFWDINLVDCIFRGLLYILRSGLEEFINIKHLMRTLYVLGTGLKNSLPEIVSKSPSEPI